MSFKQIFIKTKSYLSYQNNSMRIRNTTVDTLVSLDDIDMVIIENQQSTITSSLISYMAKSNISVIFTDSTFHPSAISIGINKNSRTSKIQKAQIFINQPKLNRLWKQIIHQKVNNQAYVINNDSYLHSLSKQIVSKDKGNIEAIASAYYFKKLFNKSFRRNNDTDNRNIALNYGYSIFRNSISRHIIAYGLNPSFGIWHCSELNSFNLSDDLIEIFRPIVDKYVADNINKDSKISSHIKQNLVGLLYIKVKNSKNKIYSANESIKNIVASYQSFCLAKRDDIELIHLF
jgi:CRISPR-associated protein Cas1